MASGAACEPAEPGDVDLELRLGLGGVDWRPKMLSSKKEPSASIKEETEPGELICTDTVVPCAETVEAERAAREPRKRSRDQETDEDMRALTVYEGDAGGAGSVTKLAKSEEPTGADATPPLFVQPLRAVRPVPGTTEPTWIRDELFRFLHLPHDLRLHFVDEKVVTASDVHSKQSRFLLPSRAVDRLRNILSASEIEESSLNRAPGEAVQEPQPSDGKRKNARGRQHGGLPVRVYDRSGDLSNLKVTKWDRSQGTVVNGERYLDAVKRAGLNKGDCVEFWAFRPRPVVRLLGTTVVNGDLCLIMAKREDQRRPVPIVPAPA